MSSASLIAKHAAAPNPFNATTNISFELTREATVRVEVFEIAGRKIDALLSEHLNAGKRKSDGTVGTMEDLQFHRGNIWL